MGNDDDPTDDIAAGDAPEDDAMRAWLDDPREYLLVGDDDAEDEGPG